VQSPSEMGKLRAATKATVASVMAGIRAIRPGVSQRNVEAAMINGCWQAGARNSKVLDFGLAKVETRAAIPNEESAKASRGKRISEKNL
jgi:hypothetical protein